jgi:hypothetical protein
VYQPRPSAIGMGPTSQSTSSTGLSRYSLSATDAQLENLPISNALRLGPPHVPSGTLVYLPHVAPLHIPTAWACPPPVATETGGSHDGSSSRISLVTKNTGPSFVLIFGINQNLRFLCGFYSTWVLSYKHRIGIRTVPSSGQFTEPNIILTLRDNYSLK